MVQQVLLHQAISQSLAGRRSHEKKPGQTQGLTGFNQQIYSDYLK